MLRNAMKREIGFALTMLVICLCIFMAVVTGGCAATAANGTTPAQTALQNTLTGFCSAAPAELAVLQANASVLSANAQTDLPIVSQGVTTLCAPGVVASAANLQSFAVTVLPAFTVIALEYASLQKPK